MDSAWSRTSMRPARFEFGGMSPQAEGEAACDRSPRKRGLAAYNFPKTEGSKANG